MHQWHLGTIGYSYKEWLGGLYPAGTRPREYLSQFSKVFNSVEVDTTFHALPRHELIQSLKVSVPADFKFSFKTPHVITHEMKLDKAEGLMLEFLDTLQPLQESLGPILVQLPPSFRRESIDVLQAFLDFLPASFRYAIELRHAGWYNDQTAQLLSEYHASWVAIDFPNIPRVIIPTTDFLYIRWIGVNGTYQHHSYERVDKVDQLAWWLKEIKEKSREIPIIYGYFNNDFTGFAAGTCRRFMIMAGLLREEDELPYQERLF